MAKNIINIKKNHDKASLLKSINHKEWRKSRNRQNLCLSKVEKARRAYEIQMFGSFTKVIAPRSFNLITNTDEVLSFIEKLDKLFQLHKDTYVKLRHVKEISEDAIVLLLSKALEFKDSRININGNKPLDNNVLAKIEKSGFFKILYDDKHDPGFEKKNDSYIVKADKTMYTHGTKSVDSELTDGLIGDAAEHIWNTKRRCRGVQRIFLELMQNTNNHASRHPGEKFWWINVARLNGPKRIAFSFIDYGMGIFQSLETKGTDNKWYGWVNKIIGKCDPNNHPELLRLMMEGKFHQTVTGKPYRGKGIPGIYNEIQKNSITKLYIISNDAFADALGAKYVKLEHQLKGTFVHFEIDASCKNLKW